MFLLAALILDDIKLSQSHLRLADLAVLEFNGMAADIPSILGLAHCIRPRPEFPLSWQGYRHFSTY